MQETCAVCLYSFLVASPTGPGASVTATASHLYLFAAQLLRRQRAASMFPAHQLMALARLSREGASTTSQLAVAERVRPQSMAQTVADMAANRLVRRRPDPTDGRKVLLEITEEGEAVLQREREARMAWLAAAIDGRLDPEERLLLDKAVALLDRLLEP
jgi:DNA-binding MarR family transcriptional regulator